MRDASQLKKLKARIFYRDRVSGGFEYVEGEVLEFKSVTEANRAWKQNWERKVGTILRIKPIDDRVLDKRDKYRHLSSVLSPEQFDRRKRKKRRN